MKTIAIFFLAASIGVMTACGGGEVAPQGPVTANDLLNLPESHDVENCFYRYEEAVLSPEDSVATCLANRFIQMNQFVTSEGDANGVLQWDVAVNIALDNFCREIPSVSRKDALEEMLDVLEKYSTQTQSEMNYGCYLEAKVDYYYTVEAYRQWLSAVPEDLKLLAQEEYEAWYAMNEARFDLWNKVSYYQSWYSMKPMEIYGYYECLSANRRAELEVERGIVLDGQAYSQKGKTVTTQQWEDWILKSSVPMDMDDLLLVEDYDHMPDEATVKECVEAMRSSFARWLAARQAFAATLPKPQGKSYDNLTADIHSRIIETLEPLIPFTY